MNIINTSTINSRLEEENKRLRISLQELSILNEIAAAISSTLSLNKLIDLIVSKCIKHFHVEQCSVTLLDRKKESSNFKTMIRKADDSKFNVAYRLDNQIVGWIMLNKKPITVNDMSSDKRFANSVELGSKIKSFISVPLMIKGQLIGILTVFNKKGDAEFASEDERLLGIIASQSAHVIENVRLYEDEQNHIALREELKHAAEIQTNLLPKKFPSIKNYDVHAVNIPAKEVGGDYYDFINIKENKIAFCLGDVTGKGLPASLLMANVQATIRSQILFDFPCNEAMNRANILLYQSTDSTKFVTLFTCVLNTDSDELTYVNAGHNDPLLISKDGQLKKLNEGGLLLGCMPGVNYTESVFSLNPGDLLVIYTDGITEAMNALQEEFGEDRLLALLKANQNLTCKEITDIVFTAVKKHMQTEPQFDDMTMLLVKKIFKIC